MTAFLQEGGLTPDLAAGAVRLPPEVLERDPYAPFVLGGGVFALGKASRAALRVAFFDMMLCRSPLFARGDRPDDVASCHDAH